MKRRKCQMCGTRTHKGEECTITNPKRSKCRPELSVPHEKEGWLCEVCLHTARVVGEVGQRYQQEHEIDD